MFPKIVPTTNVIQWPFKNEPSITKLVARLLNKLDVERSEYGFKSFSKYSQFSRFPTPSIYAGSESVDAASQIKSFKSATVQNFYALVTSVA